MAESETNVLRAPNDVLRQEVDRLVARLDAALDLLMYPHGDDDFGFHHRLARVLDVDHGDAVMRARGVCASGYGAGAHGSTCPCDTCTTNAVRSLAREQARAARDERNTR